MGDRTNITDARQHDAEQAAGVIEQAMRNEGLIDKDVRLMGEIITEALDAAGFDVVLRADPDTSDELFTEARRLLDAATPGPWERPSPTANWFTVPQPIQIDEADWGQETQENGAMCGYRIGTLADERAWRYADAELIAAAPRLIAALLAERDADVSAGAVARTVAMSHIAAERDAERVARERAEAEARQLREAIEFTASALDFEIDGDTFPRGARDSLLGQLAVIDASVAEGAEHAETAQRQMKGDPTSKTSDEINAQRDAGWPDFHPEDYCHRCGRPNGNWFIDLGEPEWYAITSGIGIVCPSCFMALDGDGLIYELRRWTPSAGPAASVAEGAEDRGQTDG